MRPRRRVYLKMASLEEAKRRFLEAFDWTKFLGEEEVFTKEALGRVTSRPVYAKRSVPAINCAAMDGFAVSAEDTFGASETNPVRLVVGKQAFPVNTGEPLPPKTNAVIMIEFVHFLEEDLIEIRAPVYPWQNVRKVGEDVVEGEMLFTQNHLIRPWDIGALLATGHLKVWVKERPRVVFVPTGDELITPEEAERSWRPEKTVEFNSAVLSATVREWGGSSEVFPIVRDDYSEILEALESAAKEEPHLIAVIAGSSAGAKDFTAEIVEREGRLLVHGVQMMPGKPVVLGEFRGRPVVGVPGYPVSAVFAFEEMVRPVFEKMLGIRLPERPKERAICGTKVPSKLGVTEFLRAKAARVGEKVVFVPIKRGAGAITTLTRADVVVRIPENSEGILQGTECEIELLRPERGLERTVLVVGSHDIALDLLSEFLKRRGSDLELSTAHVGSLSGILAVRDALAHMAGTHLFDPESGEFNIPYIKRYIKEGSVRLVRFVTREQGLIVKKGNPKGIRSLKDLTREDVRFVNRQLGSGTRVLLDYHLKQLGIDPSLIRGYEDEETTHLAVAVRVATGEADAGLGIKAAALLLNLEFVPLFKERYDLLVRGDFFEGRPFKEILSVLRDEEFLRAVEELGGYETEGAGEVIL